MLQLLPWQLPTQPLLLQVDCYPCSCSRPPSTCRGHWFDRAKLTQKNVKNTQYIACMNPTAGSFVVNPRLQRLFMTLAMDFPGQDSLMKIYGTFLQVSSSTPTATFVSAPLACQ